MLSIPPAGRAIEKGVPLKHVLGPRAVEQLAANLVHVHASFDAGRFRALASEGLDGLGLMGRARHIAGALRPCLPGRYADAVEVLVASFTPARTDADSFGLAEMFYLPHGEFIAAYGVDAAHNDGADPFEASMAAQYELTKRFTAEFSIRRFLTEQLDRTMRRLLEWTTDPDPHVRRLCSEGTRPRLPWGSRLRALVADPSPALPILEALRDDPSAYVRRSVANHLGDIAKDHPDVVFDLCERWLDGASAERRELIRHAVRHPARKGDARALSLRAAAGTPGRVGRAPSKRSR